MIAARIVAAYLVLVVIPLLAGGVEGATLALAAAHLAVAAWLWGSAGVAARGADAPNSPASRGPPDAWHPAWLPAWLSAWIPVLLIPFLYAELPLLMRWTGPTYFDPVVRGWEAALFGAGPLGDWLQGAPSSTLAGALALPELARLSLSELLHAAYLSYYPLIFAPLAILHLRGNAEGFNRTAGAVMLAFLACCAVFVVFPVQGPRYLGVPPEGIPAGPLRSLATTILEAGSSRGAAFPSSHMAVAVAHAVMALRWQRRVGWIVSALALGLGIGAVYGGFHYAIDIVVGALVGGVAALAFASDARRHETFDPVPEEAARGWSKTA